MRPGRLDRILYVGTPDLATRREIFRIRLATMAIEPNVDVDELSRLVRVIHSDRISHLTEQTVGCSGAEVVSICQDAALAAMNEDLEAPFVGHVNLSLLISLGQTITPRVFSQDCTAEDYSGHEQAFRGMEGSERSEKRLSDVAHNRGLSMRTSAIKPHRHSFIWVRSDVGCRRLPDREDGD